MDCERCGNQKMSKDGSCPYCVWKGDEGPGAVLRESIRRSNAAMEKLKVAMDVGKGANAGGGSTDGAGGGGGRIDWTGLGAEEKAALEILVARGQDAFNQTEGPQDCPKLVAALKLFSPIVYPDFDIDEFLRIDKVSCPDCGAPMADAPGGGVKCIECNYWFCY
jgi:hypothetical protein